jgi:hypothetical protein
MSLTIKRGQKGGAIRYIMEVRANRRAPIIINFFSGIFRRALPTNGLRATEERVKIPIRMPISTSLDPNLER